MCKTPGTSLRMLIIAPTFLTEAESHHQNQHPSLAAALEAKVDPQFDTLLTSLAHCGRRRAKRVVDLLAGWSRGHCEGINAAEVRAHMSQSMGMQMKVEDAAAILGGRKSVSRNSVGYAPVILASD